MYFKINNKTKGPSISKKSNTFMNYTVESRMNHTFEVLLDIFYLDYKPYWNTDAVDIETRLAAHNNGNLSINAINSLEDDELIKWSLWIRYLQQHWILVCASHITCSFLSICYAYRWVTTSRQELLTQPAFSKLAKTDSLGKARKHDSLWDRI